MRKLIHATLLAALFCGTAAWADERSPAGLWKNIDDATGKPGALIRITEQQGEFQARIEKLFRAPGEDQNPLCTACKDGLKNQPIVGMQILSGLKKDGDAYTGGQILDPNNGKVYRSKMTLQDGGKKLDVRGYIGTPLFGRSQVWIRQE